MKISVLTATYNRAGHLKKLYDSLEKNIGKEYEIEWLIMDDGSNDDTEIKCQNFKSKSGLQVKFFKQENQGKMCAINNLSEHVTGDLWIECDSDDYFIDGSFQGVIDQYSKISDRKDIYALVFLKNDQDGNNMGNNFKADESTMFDLYFKDGENGEKSLVFISNIRRKYRYELEENERFITESRMYHKMDKNYKIYCINKPIMVCEYQKNGYTKNINKQFINNPKGYYKYFYEILSQMNTSKILFSKRLYIIKHYILFTYLTRQKLNLKISGIYNKALVFLLYIPGIIKSKKFKKENYIAP